MALNTAAGRLSATRASFSRHYYLIDATWQKPISVAKQCATLLEGRHKPIYSPWQDCGDYVIVMNCSQLAMTAWNWEFKRFVDLTARPGRFRIFFSWELLRDDPGQLIIRNTRPFLPKNDLGADLLTRIYCFKDENVPQALLNKVTYMLPRLKPFRKLSEYSQEEIDQFPVIWAPDDQFKY